MGKRDKEVHFVMSEEEISRMRMKMEELGIRSQSAYLRKTDVTLTWTQEAWLIPMEDTAKWEQNWEWLYGELPKGRYRIGKEFTDFRSKGDFDTALYFAEFEISE